MIHKNDSLYIGVLLFLSFVSSYAQIQWTCATSSAQWEKRSGHASVVFDNKI